MPLRFLSGEEVIRPVLVYGYCPKRFRKGNSKIFSSWTLDYLVGGSLSDVSVGSVLCVRELFDWRGLSCVDVCLKAGRRRRRGGRPGRGASCASAAPRPLPGHPRRGRGPARELPLDCLQEMQDKGTSVTGSDRAGRGTGCGRNGVPSLPCD